MLRIFKGTGPGTILLIVITLVVLWLSAFTDPKLPPPAIYETRPMPLYFLLKMLMGEHALPGVLFSFAVLGVMLLLIVHFNTTIFFINERTFLPAVIFLLFTSLFPEYQVLNPVLPAAVLFMLALIRIMDSYRKQDIAYNFFDAGILIGTASLFYANMIWLGIILIISIAMIRTMIIKEIFLALVGLITPFLLTAGILYVAGKDPVLFLHDIGENLFGYSVVYDFTRVTTASVIIAALLLLISIVFLFGRMNTKKIKARKTFGILTWILVVSLVLYFILPSVSVEIIWISALPASYLIAHYFVFIKRKLVPEIIFSVFFLSVAVIQIFFLAGITI